MLLKDLFPTAHACEGRRLKGHALLRVASLRDRKLHLLELGPARLVTLRLRTPLRDRRIQIPTSRLLRHCLPGEACLTVGQLFRLARRVALLTNDTRSREHV